MKLTIEQARRFILLKQGLLGDYRFAGKQGALDYVRQAGCIQFDPVDVCGKMAELTLQSRVNGFTKKMLDDLLYTDRMLFDYPDKQLIRVVFGFDYSWEIYTPDEKRKYGAYVLPILYGDKFVGRIETINDRKAKTLVVKNIWYEDGIRQTKKLSAAVDKCVKRFAKFNECEKVSY